MGLFSSNRKKKEKDDSRRNESHLKNLIVLTMADGRLEEIESHLLIAIAYRLGLKESDIERVKNNLDEIKFKIPDNYEDRIEQFQDMLTLMAVDDHIDPEEEKVCRKMADKFQLTHMVVDDMLKKYK